MIDNTLSHLSEGNNTCENKATAPKQMSTETEGS